MINWQSCAHFADTDGRFVASDPDFFWPNTTDNCSQILHLEGAPGTYQLLMGILVAGPRDVRIAGARLLHESYIGKHSDQQAIGEVHVDSATMAIGPSKALNTKWQIGGPKSDSSLFADSPEVGAVAASILSNAGYKIVADPPFYSFKDRLSKEERDRVGKLIFDSGFQKADHVKVSSSGLIVTKFQFGGPSETELGSLASHLRDSGISVEGEVRGHHFAEPLTTEEIERGNELLKAAQLKSFINVSEHHSMAEIRDQIEEFPVARLPLEGSPFIVSFQSGWGDGSYTWFSLRDEKKTIGFEVMTITEDSL
jgi:hypothetical protein